MQGRGILKKPPRVRDNNGALQVRLRLDGRDHFINRLGRFDDPVAQAMAQAICVEIWRDAQQGDSDLSLNRYRPLVEGRDQDLLDAPTANVTVMPLGTSIRVISIPRKDLQIDGGLSAIAGAWQRPRWIS